MTRNILTSNCTTHICFYHSTNKLLTQIWEHVTSSCVVRLLSLRLLINLHVGLLLESPGLQGYHIPANEPEGLAATQPLRCLLGQIVLGPRLELEGAVDIQELFGLLGELCTRNFIPRFLVVPDFASPESSWELRWPPSSRRSRRSRRKRSSEGFWFLHEEKYIMVRFPVNEG